MDKNIAINPLAGACASGSQDEWHHIRLQLSDDFKACRKIFVALGDETRQHIYVTLLESPNLGMRVGAITEQTHLSRPAVSHHLQILKDAGLVAMHREGTRNFYFVNASEEVLGALDALFGRIQFISQRINRQDVSSCCLAHISDLKDTPLPPVHPERK
ncbi:MAG: metalloregulator ArsR/SmtB family transcription factor [Raoultibacter sp.]